MKWKRKEMTSNISKNKNWISQLIFHSAMHFISAYCNHWNDKVEEGLGETKKAEKLHWKGSVESNFFGSTSIHSMRNGLCLRKAERKRKEAYFPLRRCISSTLQSCVIIVCSFTPQNKRKILGAQDCTYYLT